MRLAARYNLQLMFDVAQKEVSACEFARPIRREVAEAFQALERRDRPFGPQTRIASAVNQDERLDDELELANTAIAKLDVAFDHRGRTQLFFDSPLHYSKLAQGVEIEIMPIDETVEFSQKVVAKFQMAGDWARTQERGSFPGLTETRIEVYCAIQRNDQRRIAPTRPQSEIGAEATSGQKLGGQLGQARYRLSRAFGIRAVEQ